jgi:hypothetical protein
MTGKKGPESIVRELLRRLKAGGPSMKEVPVETEFSFLTEIWTCK